MIVEGTMKAHMKTLFEELWEKALVLCEINNKFKEFLNLSQGNANFKWWLLLNPFFKSKLVKIIKGLILLN
jgi:hypothetical protein